MKTLTFACAAYYILHAITDLLGPIGPSCLGRSSFRCRADRGHVRWRPSWPA